MPQDAIYDYTFNNLQISEYTPTYGGSLVSVSGTIEVNWTAGTAYTNPTTGAYGLTVTGNFPGGSSLFTDFSNSYSPPSPTYATFDSTSGSNGLNLAFVNSGGPSGLWLLGAGFLTNDTTYLWYIAGTTDPNYPPRPCYASGTRIRTPGGDVPVQALKAGDTVVTASGLRRRVKWTARRRLRREAGGQGHVAIHIAAHALAENRPARDLVVSPDHAICIDLLGEVLIPARRLVNGATIARQVLDRVTWHHVELDSHDILLAENLPAESYLAMGNRAFFEEAGAALDSPEAEAGRTHADYCRPLVTDGPMVEFVRGRLTDRARALGWTERRAANLRLVVDGATLLPEIRPGQATFVLPADAADVRLVSDTFAPACLGYDDPRTLGVSIRALALTTPAGETRVVSIRDERLRAGAHPVEGSGDDAWRWTDGELVLDPALWAGLTGPVTLTVACYDGDLRGWDAPEAASAAQHLAVAAWRIPSSRGGRRRTAIRGRP